MKENISAPDDILQQEFIKEDDKVIIKTSQDISKILDDNAESRNFGPRFNPNKPFHRVASIPLVIVHRLMKEGVWYDRDALRAWLDNPDHKGFRTDTGNMKLGKIHSCH